MTSALKVRLIDGMPTHWRERKTVLVLFKRKDHYETFLEFSVRFRENTLVVRSTKMEEARIYSMQGKLLQKERGNLVEFELERGTYRLYAKVNGETLTRRIELR